MVSSTKHKDALSVVDMLVMELYGGPSVVFNSMAPLNCKRIIFNLNN